METHIAVDLDGTIDAAPEAFSALMEALRGDGVRVTVLTGNPTAANKLARLGVVPDAYDDLVTLPDTTLPAEKAAWCVANQVTALIDNKHANCLSCVGAGVPLALRPVTPGDVQQRQRDLLARSRRLLED